MWYNLVLAFVFSACAISSVWVSLFGNPFNRYLDITFETCQTNLPSTHTDLLVKANASMCVHVFQNMTLGKDCSWVDPTRSFAQFHKRPSKPTGALFNKLKVSKGYPLTKGYFPKAVYDMYWFPGPKQVSEEIVCHHGSICRVKVYWSSDKKWSFHVSVIQEALTTSPRTGFLSIPSDELEAHQKAELKLYGPASGKVIFNQILNGIKGEYQKTVFLFRPAIIDKKVLTYLEPIYLEHSVPDGVFGFGDL